MKNKLACWAILLLFCAPVFSASLYDSLSWFPDGKLAYARLVRYNVTTEYSFHANGHVSSITKLLNGGKRLSSRYEFYPTGNKKFDTVCEPNYYNWSWRYYPDGSKKKYIQEQFASSYQSSHTRFEIIDWDENGEVSHVFVKDEDNKVVADESYPFRQFRGMKMHRDFFPDGSLREHGFYVTDSLSGQKKKYGAWISFHANGQLKTAGLFMNDLRWGLHYIFTEEGTQLSLKNYEQGVETSFTAGKLVQRTGTAAEHMEWEWNSFTREGLIFQQNGKQVYFYYRGGMMADITAIQTRAGKNLSLGFGFPYMAYWSTWSNYSVHYEGSYLTGETESVNGSWHNSRKYNYAGFVIAENNGARQEEIRNYDNGKIARSEKPMYFSYQGTDVVTVPKPRRDSAFVWDAAGKLSSIEVYGLYGQHLLTRFYRTGKPDSIVQNLDYTRVFVHPVPGKTIEILDDDVSLPGEYTLVNQRNNVVARGSMNGARTGLWVDYDPVTGKKLTSQYYREGKPHAPGKYKEFYANGNPKQKGTYGENEQMKGVWKTYTSKGRVQSRYRYKNGKTRGISWCRGCCPNKHGRHRLRVTVHLKDSRELSFPKCFRRSFDYD